MTRFWQTLRKLRPVGKLPYKIDVPAFSVDSGYKSVLDLKNNNLSVPWYATADDHVVTNGFTLMFWVKLISGTGSVYLAMDGAFGTTARWAVNIETDNKIKLTITTDDAYIVASNYSLVSGEWTHVAITFSASASENIVKFYINNTLDKVTAEVGVGDIPTQTGDFRIGGVMPSGDKEAYISNVQYWNSELEFEFIEQYTYQIPSANNLPLGLLIAAVCNEKDATGPSDPLGMPLNIVTGNYFYGFDGDASFHAQDYPHCHVYNGSFIVGEFVLNSGDDVPFALKFPIRKPDDCTNWFACISWIDEDCGNCPYPVVKRYQLWHICPEDCLAIGSVGCGEDVDVFAIPDYNGETIPSGAKIEIWSIDGQVTADLEDIQTWLTSVLETVSSSTTTANTALLTLTVPNTELFATFPWTFPVAFNEPLVF